MDPLRITSCIFIILQLENLVVAYINAAHDALVIVRSWLSRQAVSQGPRIL